MRDKEDKRILKTKKLIKDTFFKLLKEKDFEKITIAEIADKAMISKGTFYYHYEDKYDFVYKLVNELIEEYTILMAKRTMDTSSLSDDDISKMLLFMRTRLLPEFSLMKKINIPNLNFKDRLESLMAYEIEKIINTRSDIHVGDSKIVARTIAAMQISLGDQLIEKDNALSAEASLKTLQDIISTCTKLFL